MVRYLQVVSNGVKDGEYFALIAKEDSMHATIKHGSEVLIRRQPVVENGDIVEVCIDGEITLKRFKQSGEQIMLIPDNHSYDCILF
ncbi:LexA family protein [Catellicoccus marimammalium]|uniref:LexA family protein n=1 Tax=Catellicoccus marimammalium TaxID=300419 RepID=UPI001FCC0425|nr:S24 family peptidase [Catellicoccus marimammalium]